MLTYIILCNNFTPQSNGIAEDTFAMYWDTAKCTPQYKLRCILGKWLCFKVKK